MSDSGAGLFDAMVARGPVAAQVTDAAWLAALLEVEAALARAQARAGVIPAAHADAIEAGCRSEAFDVAELGAASVESGNPVVPLVARLRATLDEPAASSVHLGATSQDVLDTASMLVAAWAGDALLDDLEGAAAAAAGLARDHRATLTAGRTLLQQALPTTFGAKAAGWLAGLDAAADRLAWVLRERLAVQLGGAAGTLAPLGPDGPRVVALLAEELGLCEPVGPWHTERTRIADLAGALGVVSAAAAKPALDIVLLAQTEVAEVRDDRPGRGGSSTLPQKRNPVSAVAARACAAQAPGLVATLLAAAGGGEHERAAGAWHAEWRPLRELWRSTGSAVAWLRDGLEHLVVDVDRMATTAASSGGLLVAERLVAELAPSVGRAVAAEEVGAASAEAVATGRPLGAVLADRPALRGALAGRDLSGLLDPRGFLGSAEAFVDRALEAHDVAAASRAGRVPPGGRGGR